MRGVCSSKSKRPNGLLQRRGAHAQDAGIAIDVSLMRMHEAYIGVERRHQAERFAADGIGEIRGHSQRADCANPRLSLIPALRLADAEKELVQLGLV